MLLGSVNVYCTVSRLFSRRSTVDAADYCGMSCDERGRQRCSI